VVLNAVYYIYRRLYAGSSTSQSTAAEEGRKKTTGKKKTLRPDIDLAEAGKRLDQLRQKKKLTKIRAQYHKIFNTQVNQEIIFCLLLLQNKC
jgi:hypothetical protein